MRKSTLFISAVLTTFVLAMLAGVASAYQNFVQPDPTEQANQSVQAEPVAEDVQSQPQVQTVAQGQPAPKDVSADLTPKEAIDKAVEVMGQDDLYSIEMTELNGESVYLVTFTSGDLIYIGLDGQVRSVDHIDVQTVVVNVSSGGGGGGGANKPDVNRSNNSSNSNSSGGEHEDHSEGVHENHEEHDD